MKHSDICSSFELLIIQFIWYRNVAQSIALFAHMCTLYIHMYSHDTHTHTCIALYTPAVAVSGTS